MSEIKTSILVTINNNYLKRINSKNKYIDFLPSCNLIIKSEHFSRKDFMNSDLFVHEDIAFCQSILKKNHYIYYHSDMYVIHKDRHVGSFLRQRITYGSEVLKLLFLYPSKKSVLMVLSLAPFFILLMFLILFF